MLDNYTYLDMELLRFTTAGSVDDGKSTLIGRLLYDSKGIFEDQLKAVQKTSERKGLKNIDFSLFTDGLKAEREQGITIDVAYRYFSTPKRKFIIADTPGHVQYTRNMVTGASTANLALILIDARNGVVQQTKRHTFIASLLRIPHLVLCVNKMDLVDYSEKRYEEIIQEFKSYAAKMDIKDIRFVPISALHGDNIVKRSDKMEWYNGGTLLHLLETIHISSDYNHLDPRLPIQYTIRTNHENSNYRGFAGQIASGIFRTGEEVTVLPSGLSTTIRSIRNLGEEIEMAFAPMSVSIELEDDIDVSRGDMLVRAVNQAAVSQDIDAMMCWFDSQTMNPKAKYILRHTTKEVKAIVKEVIYKIDINKISRDFENKEVQCNDIFRVKLRVTKPLLYDSYKKNRTTGSLILIDETTNNTVAAGMIR